MNLDFTKEDLEFRDEVRTWLRSNVPREERPDRGPAMREFDLAWQRRQYEGGWAGVSWPKEYGGRGLSLVQQMIWFEEYALAEAPFVGVCFVGINHAGPTLIAHGTEQQKAFHLPRILRGEDVWCQGFSEPGAGSDLAALQTRAEIDGEELVVTGRKIWTSFADLADWQELLVRTDATSGRHRGITWAICDMHSPGIVVRPITTMVGVPDFSEVVYDQVRIPLRNVVGEVGEGWTVAMSTLSFERGTGFIPEQVRLAQTVERLIEVAGEVSGPDGRPAIADDELARRLATARAEVVALRAMTYALISRVARVGVPGPEASMVRLYFSELEQRVYRLAMDVLGTEALVADAARGRRRWASEYLLSFMQTIAAGTKDIQRNVIGERVLGLPR